MRAYSLKKAKEVVRAFNETRGIGAAAKLARLPVEDVRTILVWLENNDPNSSLSDLSRLRGAYTLALPTSRVWVRFLYEHKIRASVAAACVNWSLERLLQESGSMKWFIDPVKRKARQGCRQSVDPQPGDPTPEEIAAAAAELRRDKETAAPRVEIKQYAFDGRNISFS